MERFTYVEVEEKLYKCELYVKTEDTGPFRELVKTLMEREFCCTDCDEGEKATPEDCVKYMLDSAERFPYLGVTYSESHDLVAWRNRKPEQCIEASQIIFLDDKVREEALSLL